MPVGHNDDGDDADDWRNLCRGEEEVLWGEGEGLGASLAGTCPKPWALKMIILIMVMMVPQALKLEKYGQMHGGPFGGVLLLS